MFCCRYLLFISIRNWNNSIWQPGTDLWSSKTESHESNKAEIKDKFRSFKMGSTERLLPHGTDRKSESLKPYLKLRDWFFKPFLKSVSNRNVWNKDNWTPLSLVLVIKTPSIYVKLSRHKKAVTYLFSLLLSNQTLVSMIHIWICLDFKKCQGSPMNAVA